jgi:hypothetical protein
MIVAPKRANHGKNMAALIEEEGLDEDGQQRKQSNTRHLRKRKRKHKQAKKMLDADDNDDEDSDFLTSGSGDESSAESGADESEGVIPNEEVSFLPLYNNLILIAFVDC